MQILLFSSLIIPLFKRELVASLNTLYFLKVLRISHREIELLFFFSFFFFAMRSWNSLDENTQSRFLFWITHSYAGKIRITSRSLLLFFFFSSFFLFIRWIIRSTNYAIFCRTRGKDWKDRKTRNTIVLSHAIFPSFSDRRSLRDPVGSEKMTLNDFRISVRGFAYVVRGISTFSRISGVLKARRIAADFRR